MINYPFQYYGSSPSAPPFPIPRTKSKLVSRKVKVKSANSRKTFAIFGCMITSFITICLITLVILYAIGISLYLCQNVKIINLLSFKFLVFLQHVMLTLTVLIDVRLLHNASVITDLVEMVKELVRVSIVIIRIKNSWLFIF